MVKIVGIRQPLDRTIWRYMPLEQLFFMLQKKALHFSPLRSLNDLYEHRPKRTVLKKLRQQLPVGLRDKADANYPVRRWNADRKNCYVNCWATTEDESIAMWRLYASHNGVAIRSTIKRLRDVLTSNPATVRLVQMEYFGEERENRFDELRSFGWIGAKHQCFEYEHELRAVLVLPKNSAKGGDVSIDPDFLVEKVVVSPDVPHWAATVICSAVKECGFNGPVEHSRLFRLH